MITNDRLAMAVTDLAANVAEQLGDAAERRVLVAQAQAGARQAANEVRTIRLKDGTRERQLLHRLVPEAILTTIKAAPGMQTLELPAGLAAVLSKLRAAMGDDQLAALLGQTMTGVGSKERQGGIAVLNAISDRLRREPDTNGW